MTNNNPVIPSEFGRTSQQPPNAGIEKRTWALNRFALVTAAITFVLIIIGALVTNNGAGNVLPEWPLSLRQLLPANLHSELAVYEYLHRIVAGISGLFVLALFLWILFGSTAKQQDQLLTSSTKLNSISRPIIYSKFTVVPSMLSFVSH